MGLLNARILHLEDSDLDADLICQRLSRAGFRGVLDRAANRSEFEELLRSEDEYDLILSDFLLPTIEGREALQLAKQERPHLPFVFVSGALGEEIAIEMLKSGATDYVLKDRLDRLAPAIERALQEVADRNERSRIEQALIESNQRFRQLADSMPQIVWTARPDGYVDYFNERWYQFTGFEPGEGGDESWEWVIHPHDLSRCKSAWYESVRTGAKYEIEYRFLDHRAGCYRWFLGRALPIRDAAGQIVKWFGSCTDIDDQKRSAEALRESEGRLRMALHVGRMVAWELAPETGKLVVAANASEVFGLPCGSDLEDLERGFGLIHPDDESQHRETIKQAVENGSSYRTRYRLIRPDTGTLVWIEERGHAICNIQGKTVRLVGVTTDITERKLAEDAVQELNDQLEVKVAERTAELISANEQLQGFTYSVTHDLRQQIRGISTNAAMVLYDAPESLDDEYRQMLERLVQSAKQLSELVDDLLAYARLGRHEARQEPVNLSDLAARISSQLSMDRECNPETSIHVEPDLIASGDPSMLGIALQNLIDNAVKYSRHSSPPVVRIGRDSTGFYVEDNGIGFEMEYSNKIFEPFERLHRGTGYAGTGIGLANVKRIIEKHGGKVWAEGEPGKGAKFYFTLG